MIYALCTLLVHISKWVGVHGQKMHYRITYVCWVGLVVFILQPTLVTSRLPCLNILHPKYFSISGYHILNTPLHSSTLFKIWVIFSLLCLWHHSTGTGVSFARGKAGGVWSWPHIPSNAIVLSEGISPLTIMPSWLAHGQLHGIFELEVSGILRYGTALLFSRFQTLLRAAGIHYIFWRKCGERAKRTKTH